MRFCFK